MSQPALESAPPATPPPATTPPSMLAPAQSISTEQLRAELSAPPAKPAAVVAEVKEAPRQESPRPDGAPKLPDFKEAMRKEVMEKPKEEPAKKEKKAVVSTDDAPPPAKEEKKPDEPLSEEQLRVLPHDKPETAKRIKQLHGLKTEAEKAAAAARAELEALKKQAPTAANTEEIAALKAEHAKLAEEAARLRRRYEWEADPEVKTKYVEPVRQTEETITGTLKKLGYAESTLKVISDEGGFAEFSRSRRSYPVNVPDPDNEGQVKREYRTGAEIAHGWLAAMPVADAEDIKASIGRQQLLRSEEKAARAAAEANAKQYFESQTAAQRQASEQAQAAATKAKTEYDEWLKGVEDKTDFLKDRTVPDNAAAEERKAIEEHNAFNKQLRDSLRKHPSTTAEYTALKLDAAEAHHLRRTLGARDAEIAALKEQLAKKSAALKTTPNGGSLMSKTKPATTQQPNKNPTDFLGGLRAQMQAATGSADDE